jgi:hypothetical protein
MAAVANPPGKVARDGDGKPVEKLSTINWRARMVPLTNAAWVDLSDGEARNHILIRTLNTAAARIILAPASTGYTNDLTNSTCGAVIEIGQCIELDMTENLDVFARVESGGAAVNAYVAEAL